MLHFLLENTDAHLVGETILLPAIGIGGHRQLARGAVAILSEAVAVILDREETIGTAPAVVAGASLLRRASCATSDKTTNITIAKS